MSEYDDDFMIGHLDSQYSTDSYTQTHDNVPLEAGSQHQTEVDAGTVKKPRQKNYSGREDIVLVSAFLNIGFDPVVGADQHKTQLWERILKEYSANLEGKGYPPRTKDGLENRWSLIKKDCKKFRGCLASAEKHRESGGTESNTFEVAKALYQDKGGKPFLFTHCWDALKDHPIWANISVRVPSHPTSSSSASPGVINVADNVEDVPDSDMHSLVRPPGKRAELKRRKKEQSKEQHGLVVEHAFASWNDSENKRRTEEQRLTMEIIQLDKERMEREDSARLATLALEQKRMQMEASAKEESLKIEREKMERQSKTRAIELGFEKQKMAQDRIEKEQARKEHQTKLDMEIMNKDFTGLSDVQIEFFKLCQSEVLARWKKD